MHPLVERYLLLGLRLGRHVEGLVDGYYGPPELRERAESEELPPAAVLAEEARDLRAELAGADLAVQRARWLAAQLDGLECAAELAGGVAVPWREAVRRCYGIEVEPTAESEFERAHALLDEALPGDGDLAERLERWRETQTVARDRILPAFEHVAAELRRRTARIVELPEGERFDAALVEGKRWVAYNWYAGNLTSRIEINVDRPVRSNLLVVLAAHEGYPGHHVEAACKEARLVRGEGRDEVSILLVHTPECLVAEGIAEIAVEQALGRPWAPAAAELLDGAGVPFDTATAQVVEEAEELLRSVGVNVACYAAERGWDRETCVAYLRRWALSTEERARQAAAFDTDPVWSIYVPTYSYGRRLARAFAASRADGFAALLTEQLTPADLGSTAGRSGEEKTQRARRSEWTRGSGS